VAAVQPTPTRSPFCHSVTLAPTFSTPAGDLVTGNARQRKPWIGAELHQRIAVTDPQASTWMRICPDAGSGNSRLDQLECATGLRHLTALIIFGMVAPPASPSARRSVVMHGARCRCVLSSPIVLSLRRWNRPQGQRTYQHCKSGTYRTPRLLCRLCRRTRWLQRNRTRPHGNRLR